MQTGRNGAADRGSALIASIQNRINAEFRATRSMLGLASLVFFRIKHGIEHLEPARDRRITASWKD
jgi:hypothetical protein